MFPALQEPLTISNGVRTAGPRHSTCVADAAERKHRQRLRCTAVVKLELRCVAMLQSRLVAGRSSTKHHNNLDLEKQLGCSSLNSVNQTSRNNCIAIYIRVLLRYPHSFFVGSQSLNPCVLRVTVNVSMLTVWCA